MRFVATKSKIKKIEILDDTLVHSAPVNEEKKKACCGGKKKCWWLLVILAGLVFFWYKTNTWPIVAMVNFRPITRFEINKTLFTQGGTLAIDEIVTQIVIEAKLKKMGITVPESEIEQQITSIREALGTEVTLEARLEERGLSMKELREQIRIQLGLEKAVKDKVQVTDQEIQDYVKQLGSVLPGDTEASKSAEAESALRSQKLQDELSKWIEETRAEMKVWYINDSMKVPQSSGN
jgi:hypothetical protein